MSSKINFTPEEWKIKLSQNPEAYHVLREKGTEKPFSGAYYHHDKPGIYYCAGCDSQLFDSGDKFDSGCGWPAFSLPINSNSIITIPDHSHGMKRVEVQCSNCNGHLGHVFDDGPKDKGGSRYCINSASLSFKDDIKRNNSKQ